MGTGVFGGMLAATFIATIFIPLFFVLLTRRTHRVQRHDHRLLEGQRLQSVDQVMQAHRRLLVRRIRRALVVPRRPGAAPTRQQPRVGVQQRPVGVVADRAQLRALVV